MKVFAHSTRGIWACSVALVLLVLSATPALACTPPPGGLPVFTIAQRVQAADVVLEGDVTQLKQIQFPGDTATIGVTRYFKGSGPASVTITNFGSGGLCRSQVAVGDHWIFFARGDPDAVMTASYLSQFDAVASATDDTIAQIRAALNMRPRAFLPLLTNDRDSIVATVPGRSDDRGLLGLALIAVGIIAAWLRFAAR